MAALAVAAILGACDSPPEQPEEVRPPLLPPVSRVSINQREVPGGTVNIGYPFVTDRPPKGEEFAPPGYNWAHLEVRFCAGPEAPIDGDLVDSDRFRLEYPGQAPVGPIPNSSQLTDVRRGPLVDGTAVSPGTCMDGSIVFLMKGKDLPETITFTFNDGNHVIRWEV